MIGKVAYLNLIIHVAESRHSNDILYCIKLFIESAVTDNLE